MTSHSAFSYPASIFYKMPLSQLLSQLKTNHNRRWHWLTDIALRLANILSSWYVALTCWADALSFYLSIFTFYLHDLLSFTFTKLSRRNLKQQQLRINIKQYQKWAYLLINRMNDLTTRQLEIYLCYILSDLIFQCLCFQ